MRIWIEDMPSGYASICQSVLQWGEEVSPRGQKTKEILDAVIIMEDPTRALPIGTGRKLNPAIAAVEALQLIGGRSVPSLTTQIAPNMKQFLEPEGHFHGAYGPRVVYQMKSIIGRLNRDPDTRQAVITIWDPSRDLMQSARDLPCTVMLMFVIRNDRLQLHTTMRSNDVWWGLTYDMFQFTQLQLTLSAVMGVAPGPYFHHAVSMHAYERDWESIERLERHPMSADVNPLHGIVGGEYGDATESVIGCGNWMTPAMRAQEILYGNTLNSPSPTEEWYRAKLAPFVG